jgi:transcriptional regulator with XRE-family HTH domain
MDVQLRIDEVLKLKNMTQVDLAKKINRSKVTVNYWCSNKNLPSLSTLSTIAKVLNVKISDLIIEN